MHKREDDPGEPAEPQEREDLLGRMLADLPPALERTTGKMDCVVGVVTDERHPTVEGRAQVAWRDAQGMPFERWLPTLQSLSIHKGDRVLMIRASNCPEYIVSGVIDGLADLDE
jgi:hypothetical protein